MGILIKGKVTNKSIESLVTKFNSCECSEFDLLLETCLGTTLLYLQRSNEVGDESLKFYNEERAAKKTKRIGTFEKKYHFHLKRNIILVKYIEMWSKLLRPELEHHDMVRIRKQIFLH